MAPESVTEKTVDEKTDIYNFGATMYRMFTGRYANYGIPKTGEGGINKTPAPNQINVKIPAVLNDLIVACVEKNPEKRPASMFDVQNQLAEVAKYFGLEENDLKGVKGDDDE
jgi:serine/threonine-protein kinase